MRYYGRIEYKVTETKVETVDWKARNLDRIVGNQAAVLLLEADGETVDQLDVPLHF